MKQYKTLIFILGTFALLALVCVLLPQPTVSVGPLELHFPTLEGTLRPPKPKQTSAEELLQTVTHEIKPQLPDSAELARLDSLAFYTDFFRNNPSRIHFPNDSAGYIFPFFAALDSARAEAVHVIHYGDSQIEGDRISGYLRSQLQKKFGGNGPGLLPMVQPISAMSVAQQSTDSITMFYAGGMMGGRAPHNRYGAMAQVAQTSATDSATVGISARNSKRFKRITIFAGHIDSTLTLSINKSAKTLGQSTAMRHVTWAFKKPFNKFSLDISGKAEIYGMHVGDDNGVTLSNIPMRGSDGTFFTRIDRHAMAAMHKQLNTRLVIMEFGGNALPQITDSAGVRRYCKGFARQLNYMQSVCPQAQILVIGPADMSVKIDGTLQTHPMLPYLVDMMCSTSTQNNAAYWDMYSVMGGYDSMIAWVGHQPAWAATDYIHFTTRGANRIANVLWETIMVYYDYRSFTQNRMP